MFRAGAPSSWALFPSSIPVWASSRHNYLSIISSFHGPGAQPHHDLSHAPVSKAKAAALPELASLSFDAIAIHFHESQLCSQHRQPDTRTEVVALLEGLSCMLEKRLLLQEEDREDSDQPGFMSTGPSWDVGTGHNIKKQMKGIDSPMLLTLATCCGTTVPVRGMSGSQEVALRGHGAGQGHLNPKSGP